MTNPPIYLDRRVTEASSGVSVAFDGTKTTWTLPYAVALDGSEGIFSIVRNSDRTTLAVTQESTTSVSAVGNYIGVPVHIGLIFRTILQFTVIYRRDPNRNNAPDTRGRTNLRYLKLGYENATSFTVVVNAGGRLNHSYSFDAADPSVPESGIFSVPVQCENTQATITVVADDAGAANFSGYEWEGLTYQRLRNGRR